MFITESFLIQGNALLLLTNNKLNEWLIFYYKSASVKWL